MTSSRGLIAITGSFLIVAAALAACDLDRLAANFTTGGQADPIEPPPGDQLQFSQYAPDKPFEMTAARTLSRTVFEAGKDAGIRVAVQDWLVGPGQRTSEFKPSGGVVIEVRSGVGAVVVDGDSAKVATGSALAVSQGQRLSIVNEGTTGLLFRTFLIQAD